MSGPLLRTGTLTDYHPVGAVGHPVYLAAAQLRAALARRLGPDLADSLAIPQRNEDGDTLDWYAPHPGPVVPWSSASAEERVAAQRQLLENRARIDELAQTMLADPDPERQVFARLLAHVLSFPDQEHIYLVDGRPVISFWGFVHDRDAVGSDPLVDLGRLAADPPSPEPRSNVTGSTEAGESVAASRGLPWWLWFALLLIPAVVALLFLLRGCEPIASVLFPEKPVVDETSVTQSRIDHSDNTLVPMVDETLTTQMPFDVDGVTDRTAIDRDLHTDRVTGSSAGSLVVDSDRTVFSETDSSTSLSLSRDSATASSVSRDHDSRVDNALITEDTIESGSADAPIQPGLETVAEDGPVMPEPEPGLVEGELPVTEGVGALPGDGVETPLPGPEADVDAGLSDPAIDPSATESDASVVDEAAGVAGMPEDLDALGEGSTDDLIPEPTERAGPGVDPTADMDSPMPAQDAGDAPPPASADPAGRGEAEASAVPESSADTPAGTAPAGTAPGAAGAPGAAAPAAAIPGGAAPAAAGVRAGTRTGAGARPAMKDLSSGWQTATSLQDPKTGLPIQMEYRTQDGAGQLRLKRHDGSICQSSAAASVEEDRLVIDSSGDIRCADGTNFGRPRVECTPGKDGKPSCVGRNPDGTSFSFDVQGAAEP